MKTSTFLVVAGVAVAGALGAVAANFLIGERLFEKTVVENPYETGLRYDEEQRKAAAPTCAISAGRCEVRVAEADAVVTLEIAPRPVRAMSDLTFTVGARRGALPIGDAEGEISLAMVGMYMGENRVRLAPLGSGYYQGKGLIVRCPSGRRTWSAEVILRPREPATAAPVRAVFTFEIAE